MLQFTGFKIEFLMPCQLLHYAAQKPISTDEPYFMQTRA